MYNCALIIEAAAVTHYHLICAVLLQIMLHLFVCMFMSVCLSVCLCLCVRV